MSKKITITVSTEFKEHLQSLAGQEGKTLEDYVLSIFERSLEGTSLISEIEDILILEQAEKIKNNPDSIS